MFDESVCRGLDKATIDGPQKVFVAVLCLWAHSILVLKLKTDDLGRVALTCGYMTQHLEYMGRFRFSIARPHELGTMPPAGCFDVSKL